MAVLYAKIGGQVVDVGGPGTPQPIGAAVDVANTWTADQTFSGKVLSPGDGPSSMRLGNTSAANVPGTNAIAIGPSSKAGLSSADTECTAVGKGAEATGNTSSAYGGSAIASGLSSGAFARNAVASGSQSLAMGASAKAEVAGAIAVGFNARVTAGTDNIAIGRNSLIDTGSGESVAVGGEAHVECWRGTAIGWHSYVGVVSSTALGRGAYANGAHSYAIGRGSMAVADGQGGLGNNSTQHHYLGSGHTSTFLDRVDGTTQVIDPTTRTMYLHGFDGYDETNTTNNIAGGSLVLAAGVGTGTAAGGSVALAVGPAGGASNNTKNSLVNVVEAGVSGTSTTLGFFATTPRTRRTGWAVATGTATRTSFDTATVTTAQLAERVKALIDDFHSTAGYGLLAA